MNNPLLSPSVKIQCYNTREKFRPLKFSAHSAQPNAGCFVRVSTRTAGLRPNVFLVLRVNSVWAKSCIRFSSFALSPSSLLTAGGVLRPERRRLDVFAFCYGIHLLIGQYSRLRLNQAIRPPSSSSAHAPKTRFTLLSRCVQYRHRESSSLSFAY
jgi:hypothetical protein